MSLSIQFQNALVDSFRVSELLAGDAPHEATTEDAVAMDDGNAGNGRSPTSLRVTRRYPQAHKVCIENFVYRCFN